MAAKQQEKKYQLRPPKLRIEIPCYTSYNTISISYTPLPRGNDRIDSSDLLDSGCWVPRSLQVHHQRCTGEQRGAHPWDHSDGPRGHFHKSCNQKLEARIHSTQVPNQICDSHPDFTEQSTNVHLIPPLTIKRTQENKHKVLK